MFTTKDIKEFRGLTNKQRAAAAADIGRKYSEGTALGKVAMMALAAGLDAKEAGDKTFTFDSTFNSFASEYFSNVTDGTLKTYRSAFGNWSKAGMHPAFDATELAVRVWNESKYALSARGTMLKRLLKDAPPTVKEYNAAKPTSENNPKPKTVGKAAEALLRSVDDFVVSWGEKITTAQSSELKALRIAVAAFASKLADGEAPAPKPKTKGKGPTPAELRKVALAKLMAAPDPKGHKTLQ